MQNICIGLIFGLSIGSIIGYLFCVRVYQNGYKSEKQKILNSKELLDFNPVEEFQKYQETIISEINKNYDIYFVKIINNINNEIKMNFRFGRISYMPRIAKLSEISEKEQNIIINRLLTDIKNHYRKFGYIVKNSELNSNYLLIYFSGTIIEKD